MNVLAAGSGETAWKLIPKEAFSKVLFYRGDVKAQRNKILNFNPLRLCVIAV
jgi:hypothetical protein